MNLSSLFLKVSIYGKKQRKEKKEQKEKLGKNLYAPVGIIYPLIGFIVAPVENPSPPPPDLIFVTVQLEFGYQGGM